MSKNSWSFLEDRASCEDKQSAPVWVDLTRLGCPPRTGLEPPTTLTGDKTVFCCSHVELEYFEVYFLYNNEVFDISHHSVSTLEILESQDLSCEFF
jgi:hypothetical protein